MHQPLAEILDLFEFLDGTARLDALVEFGERLPALDERYCALRDSGMYIIRECRSPVFFYVEVQNGVVNVRADAPREAPLARGLAGLLYQVIDGSPIGQLGSLPEDLLTCLGIRDTLSLQRQRGMTAIYQGLLDGIARGESAGSDPDATSTATPIVQVAAVVLAAGESRRMGVDNKLLLPVAGKPMIARTVTTIIDAGIREIVVVVGHDAERVEAALNDYDVGIVRNDRFSEGMSTSVRAGVGALAIGADRANGADGIMICLSDQPLIEPREISRMIEQFAIAVKQNPKSIVVPVFEGTRGNPVIFSKHYRGDMLQVVGDRGCRDIIASNAEQVVRIEMDSDHVLVDVDTLDAYRALAKKTDG